MIIFNFVWFLLLSMLLLVLAFWRNWSLILTTGSFFRITDFTMYWNCEPFCYCAIQREWSMILTVGSFHQSAQVDDIDSGILQAGSFNVAMILTAGSFRHGYWTHATGRGYWQRDTFIHRIRVLNSRDRSMILTAGSFFGITRFVDDIETANLVSIVP